jgi:UPF0755 protein
MTSKKNPLGKRILFLIILILILFIVCLFSGIIATIPARTAEIYGPPSPSLNTQKLYTQCLILLLSKDQLTTPSNLSPAELVFPIEEGDTLDEILAGLQSLNLVNHPSPFRAYLIYTGIDTRIQPGEYLFSSAMSELEIAQTLGSPADAFTTISILSGWRAEEVAQALPDLGLTITQDQFLEAVNLQEREGYLFPGTYQVERNISTESLVNNFYERFLSQITPELEEKIEEQGLSTHQAVTLASMIEREAVLTEEMPLIASVFLNRLRLGMNLASDPTIQYALGYNTTQGTWWTNPLTLEDLKISSPYNTYENPGLPPRPICNPGLPALLAVAYPADSSYLYFRASCDGSGGHLFSETYEKHLGNACPE